ncbi:MAG: hypothetical protein E7255_15090 [Lachnospiraceae bacterium]|nr:hypothetical protein [Lachnospiraceae bacterium]
MQEFLSNGDVSYLYPQLPMATTLEGQIIPIADEIAQRSHDLDDSFASGILDVEQLRNYLSLQKMRSLQKPLQIIEHQLNEAKEKRRVFVNIEELRHSRIVSAVIDFFINDTIIHSKN